MSITWDSVEALAPALSTVTAEAQTLILAQVARQVGEADWGDWVDDGQTYLAAHLGSLVLGSATSGSSQAVGPVISETAGPVSRSYAVLTTGGEGTFASTNWGQEYARLRALLMAGAGFVI